MTEQKFQLLAKELQEFEKFRKKTYRRHRIMRKLTWPLRAGYVIALILAVVSSLLPFLLPGTLPFILIMVGLFLLETLVIDRIFGNPEYRFDQRFANKIKPFFFQTLFSNTTYKVDKHISTEVAVGSKLFGPKIERSYGANQVDGELEGVKFRFSTLTLLQQKSFLRSLGEGIAEIPFEILATALEIMSDGVIADDGDDGDDLVMAFNGGVGILTHPVKSPGSVILEARGNKWMKMFRKSYRRGRTEMQTGDAEFDAVFKIYGTNEIRLDALLPDLLRKKLLKLQAKGAPQVAISIVDGHMYLALPIKGEWLKCYFDRPLPDPSYYIKRLAYIEQLQEIAGALAGKQSVDDHSRYMPK